MLYKRWIVAIKRDEGSNFKVTKFTKVCSKHFQPCDFTPGLASGHNILRETAVPSVFRFRKVCKTRKPPKRRASPLGRKSSKQVLIEELTPEPADISDPDDVSDFSSTAVTMTVEGTSDRLNEEDAAQSGAEHGVANPLLAQDL